MRDRDSAGAPARFAPLAELLLLDRLSPGRRAAAVLLALGTTIGWGFIALALHEHELALRAAGEALGSLGTIFADASSPLTAWPGWAAAAILGMSTLRLRRGALEPPTRRGTARNMSAAELRAGLRREYAGARSALVAVGMLTLADLARLAVSGVAALLAESGAGDGIAWMGIEVAGLIAATAALTAWVLSFRKQLDRIGALRRPSAPDAAAESDR
jgi:hypothetical protein